MKFILKTKFTQEEIYQAYIGEVIEALVYHFKMESKEANDLITKAEIKKSFFKRPQDYDFLEPEWVAKTIHKVHINDSNPK